MECHLRDRKQAMTRWGTSLLHSASILLLILAYSTVSATRTGVNGTRCLDPLELWILAERAGLPFEETAALEEVGACVPETGVTPPYLLNSIHDGIPEDVQCQHHKWCDSQGICTEVCERGTVQIDTWYAWASGWQRRVAAPMPFCYTSMLGTHNSAISMADGYGNQDQYWQWYLQYLPSTGGPSQLYTNDQWMSLTDQLNIGVRLIELDTHWVAGHLRTAHCGGVHAPAINTILRALNALSKLAGRKIHWDTETIGCNPSLSSLPVKDQRLFKETLAEIRDWLELPRNVNEFVVLFLDDERDLRTWGKVTRLVNELRAAFPKGWLWTPDWKQQAAPGVWPSTADLRSIGARVMAVSRKSYGPIAWPILFNNTLCNWWEPKYNHVAPPPECFDKHGRSPGSGTFSRINDCRLEYGPLNCDFFPRSSSDHASWLSPAHMDLAAMCGWNCLSPDWLTPELAKHSIWSWAPGEPRSLGLQTTPTTPHEANTLANTLLDGETSLVYSSGVAAAVPRQSVLQAVEESVLAPGLLLPSNLVAQESTRHVRSDEEKSESENEELEAGEEHVVEATTLVQHLRHQSSALKQAPLDHVSNRRIISTSDVSKGVPRAGDGPQALSMFEIQKFGHPREAAMHASGTALRRSSAAATPPACAAMSNIDGRWRSVQCASSLPASCKSVLPFPSENTSILNSSVERTPEATSQQLEYMHSNSSVALRPQWMIGSEVVFSMESGWALASGSEISSPDDDSPNPSPSQEPKELAAGAFRRLKSFEPMSGVQCEGCCPSGYAFVYPQSGWDNLQLWIALNASGKARVMLPIIPGVLR